MDEAKKRKLYGTRDVWLVTAWKGGAVWKTEDTGRQVRVSIDLGDPDSEKVAVREIAKELGRDEREVVLCSVSSRKASSDDVTSVLDGRQWFWKEGK